MDNFQIVEGIWDDLVQVLFFSTDMWSVENAKNIITNVFFQTIKLSASKACWLDFFKYFLDRLLFLKPLFDSAFRLHPWIRNLIGQQSQKNKQVKIFFWIKNHFFLETTCRNSTIKEFYHARSSSRIRGMNCQWKPTLQNFKEGFPFKNFS